MSQPSPWAPIHILFKDLYDIREARGDNYIYPPDIAPERCKVCGAPYGTCVDTQGNYTQFNPGNNTIEYPEV